MRGGATFSWLQAAPPPPSRITPPRARRRAAPPRGGSLHAAQWRGGGRRQGGLRWPAAERACGDGEARGSRRRRRASLPRCWGSGGEWIRCWALGMLLRVVNVFVCLPPRFGFGLFGFSLHLLLLLSLPLSLLLCVLALFLVALLCSPFCLLSFFSFFFPSQLPRQASFSPQGAKRGC